jgi:NDP-sugar pyrophosphorylase family protein
MPIGDRSILEIVIEQLSSSGFKDIVLCVGYLSHIIQAVLEGRSLSASITYHKEEYPLGTVGPLRLVEGLEGPFIAMNGDVLTTLDYRDMFEHHLTSENALTIGVHERTMEVDYGVPMTATIENGGPPALRVVEYSEKPRLNLTISMGVYVIEPRVLDYIPEGSRYDVPDLIQALLAANEPVGAYPFPGFWLDIGRHEDYEVAVEMWEEQVKALEDHPDGAHSEVAHLPGAASTNE